jgi:hypothetical protein
MSRKRPFTADEIALCRSWRNAGVSWRRIADRLDTTPDLLRMAADPGFPERRLEQRRLNSLVRKLSKAPPRPVDVEAVAPEPAPEPVLTPSAEIMRLHGRRVPLTSIAAMVRQPYRVVSEVIARGAAR